MDQNEFSVIRRPQTSRHENKEIEERIASSDLSKSNWCPSSFVEPMVVDLGDLKAGSYTIKTKIQVTPVDGDKFNYWLVFVYLNYE